MKLDRYSYQPRPEHSGWLMHYRHPQGYAIGTLPVVRFERHSPPITLGLPPALRTRSLGVKAELDDGSSYWFMFEPELDLGERSCAGCRDLVEDDFDHQQCETPVDLHPSVAFSLLPRSWLRIASPTEGDPFHV